MCGQNCLPADGTINTLYEHTFGAEFNYPGLFHLKKANHIGRLRPESPGRLRPRTHAAAPVWDRPAWAPATGAKRAATRASRFAAHSRSCGSTAWDEPSSSATSAGARGAKVRVNGGSKKA